MVHVWLRDPHSGECFLRSRFWIGSELRPYLPSRLADAAARLINRPLFRRIFVPRAAPAALGLHCAEEYSNLARFLPGLYATHVSAAPRA